MTRSIGTRASLALLLATLPLLATAEDLCVPPAVGVPGNPGPPDWFTTAPAQDTNLLWDTPWDPRWVGAAAVGYVDGTGPQAQLRVLHGSAGGVPSLSVSWYINSVADILANETSLFMGFTRRDGKGVVLAFTLVQQTTVDPGLKHWDARISAKPGSPVSYAAEVRQYLVDPFSLKATELLIPEAWVTDAARVWSRLSTDAVNGPSISGPTTVSAQNQWAIQVKVPITAVAGAGIDLDPASFRMWHEAQLNYVYGSTNSTAIIPLTWPRTGTPAAATYMFQGTFSAPIFPDPGSWGTAKVGTAGCTGVDFATDALGAPDLGTNYPGEPSRIDVNWPGGIAFHVGTSNTDPATQGAAVQATWRFANWGSQVGDLTASSWAGPAELSGVTGSAPGSISGPRWIPDDTWRCKFLGSSGCPTCSPACPNAAPVLESHQCAAVSLSGGVNFLRSSIYRNMDFAAASVFQRGAEINIAGLPPTPAGRRDVYLYVETLDMPTFASDQLPQQPAPVRAAAEQGAAGSELTANRGKEPPPRSLIGARPQHPGQVVHAFYDTGLTVNLFGNQRLVLLPLTSFGYQVRHQGPLEGWLTETRGATPIGDSTTHFKVTAPDGGAAKITTVIEAVEPKRLSVGLSIGAGLPYGSWAQLAKAGLAGALDVEYQLAGPLSLGLGLGYDGFGGKSPGVDVKALRLSAQARLSPLGGQLRPFLLAGAGVYRLDPGSTSGGGFAGLGLQALVTHAVAVELSVTAHTVASTPRTTWVDALAGVRLRF